MEGLSKKAKGNLMDRDCGVMGVGGVKVKEGIEVINGDREDKMNK